MNKTGNREQGTGRRKVSSFRFKVSGLGSPALSTLNFKLRTLNFFASYFMPLFAFVFLLSALVFGGTLSDSEIHKRANAITAKLRCPVCQNLSVSDSDSFMANQIKDKIKKMLKEGKTEKDIMDYFQSKYGDFIYLSPPKRGFNIVVWILPFIGLAGGALLIMFSLRSMKGKPADALSADKKESARLSFSEEIKKELDKYDY